MAFFIEKTPTFDVAQTLECGQVFRFKENSGAYEISAGAEHAVFVERNGEYSVDATDEKFFKKYFDFDRNYDIIQNKVQDKSLFWSDKVPIRAAMEFGKGIHILNQLPFETVISFIISANNHIPRIKGIIERICENLGENKGGYFAFPSPQALASENEEFFKRIGAGYRASYLAETSKRLLNVNFAELATLDTPSLRRELLSFKGVGRKVADCILLFAFHRTDSFPVDTWIEKVFRPVYGDISAEKMSELLVKNYGEYSGYVQQWLFFWKRTLD